MRMELRDVNAVVDRVTQFIASETGLDVLKTRPIFCEIHRLFFNSWVNRGCRIDKVRCSKSFWFTVDGFKPRGELADLWKWMFSLLHFVMAILLRRKVFACGARDKQWVKSFYHGAAARIDFRGRPDFLVQRNEVLREGLKRHLLSLGMNAGQAEAVKVVLPEDLLEGCILQIKLFMIAVRFMGRNEICSEDFIENVSSACLVAATLRFGWEFTYKEHALPTLIFRNHISWEHARVASKVILTEDYEGYILDESIRRKCVYSKKTRNCRFTHDPQGKRLLCIPFVSGFASGMHWTGDSDYVRDLRFDERDRDVLRSVLKSLSQTEEILTRYHPCRCEGVSLSTFPTETFDGSGVKEVVFVGWTQGFFECLDAGIPARIILTRRFLGLSDGGNEYFHALEQRGVLEYILAASEVSGFPSGAANIMKPAGIAEC
jgi:hypothetical protein